MGWISVSVGFFFMMGAVISLNYGKFLKSLFNTYDPMGVSMATFEIGTSLWLILIFLTWILRGFGHRLKGFVARCAIKVIAYSISATAFMFLFKVGAKADFHHHLKASIEDIKHVLDHESIANHIRQDVFGKLDWQFTNIHNLLFIDLEALIAVFFLCLSFLCIGRAFDDPSALMDWLFNLFCDIATHMASDVFGRRGWWVAMCVHFAIAGLIVFKEYSDHTKKKKQQDEAAAMVPVERARRSPCYQFNEPPCYQLNKPPWQLNKTPRLHEDEEEEPRFHISHAVGLG